VSCGGSESKHARLLFPTSKEELGRATKGGDNDHTTNQTEMIYQTVIVASLLLGNASSFLAGHSGRINESRRLLPSPPHLGLASGPEQSKAYKGCLGLSKEELEKASQFIDNMPKCEVIVGGNTVVSNTGGEESSDSLSDGDVTTTSAESSSTEVTVYDEVDSTQATSTGDSGNADGMDDVNYDGTITSSYGEESNDDKIQTSGSNEEDSNVGDDEESNIDDQASDVATAAANENGESPSPLQYFDMTDCGSFSSIWMFDLAITCANSTSLDSCDCTAAKLHIFYGDIDCVFDECPANCIVCDMCMKLTGCLDSDDDATELVLEEVGSTEAVAAVPIAFMGLTAALFGIQLVLFKMYWSRRAQPGGTLGAQLMDEQLV